MHGLLGFLNIKLWRILPPSPIFGKVDARDLEKRKGKRRKEEGDRSFQIPPPPPEGEKRFCFPHLALQQGSRRPIA